MLALRVLKPCSTYACRLQPKRAFWPLAGSVMQQLEADLRRHMEDMKRVVNLAGEAHRQFVRGSLVAGRFDSAREAQVSSHDGKDGFAVSLDVSRFAPEELTVKVIGRKVSVAGRQQDVRDQDADGVRSYEFREFRKVFDLSRDVNAEAVSCRWSKDGQLHIEAPSLAPPPEKEQSIPISNEDAEDGEKK